MTGQRSNQLNYVPLDSLQILDLGKSVSGANSRFLSRCHGLAKSELYEIVGEELRARNLRLRRLKWAACLLGPRFDGRWTRQERG